MKPKQFTIKIQTVNERGYGVGFLEENDQNINSNEDKNKDQKDDQNNHKNPAEKKSIFVLNALPGETVLVETFKKKQGTFFARALQIITPSKHRVEATEEHFLASSPWQIMDFTYENGIKAEMIKGFFAEENIDLPLPSVVHNDQEYGYRNKVEFGFYSVLKNTNLQNPENPEDPQNEISPEESSEKQFEETSEKISKESNQETTEELFFSYFKREGSKGKYPLISCNLMPDEINSTALNILNLLRSLNFQARQLKSLLLRYSFSQKKVVAYLFVKDENLEIPISSAQLIINQTCVGFHICYSNPKSPASIISSNKISLGQTQITEEILDLNLTYPVDGFFQVNPVMFAKTAKDIQTIVYNLLQNQSEEKLKNKNENELENQTQTESESETENKSESKSESKHSPQILDLYAGVGTIGLFLADKNHQVHGVELFEGSKKAALQNAFQNNKQNYYTFTEASAEKSLQEITKDKLLIVDPPRVGLHTDVIKRILEVQPEFLIYLSCNPKTQAENMALLAQNYKIIQNIAYNFYPHTPHCEHLIVCQKI